MAEWKDKFNPLVVTELIGIAKSPERFKIAKWDITYNLNKLI